uniref:Adenylate kinase n=1 Tax=uncultured actinobacterium Rifle_16ft_4_minimus_550 TaxID=1665149 RepID=A0A0H4TC47_9ACTN|nr:adenylate kinase, adenylate kinase [uncultured actinobacterium Rifle_16ft_4_minimus_550]
MNIALLGAPGSGKGTQAKVLAKEYGLAIISTGDILRAEVNKRSKVGQKIKSYMNDGELVPDEVVIEVIRARLKGEKGFILDGFPRNLAQAKALKGILEELNKGLDGVIYFDVGQEELVRRLSQRRICSKCQAVYHLVSKPPRNENICDLCGGALYQREDDKPASIKRRFEVYMKETAPLISYYKNASLLRVVNGEESPGDVRLKIYQTLSQTKKNAREQLSR